MARKLRGFERVLDSSSLFAVAYGEIASSLYIALGIVAGAALGLTPLVLLVTGAVFVLVSLSYAEGTTALPETGGAATFVRRAFNDLAGFITGWVLFLDFLIVMALSALFVPHYFAGAFRTESLRESPWDAVIGCLVILAIASVRLVRRTRLHTGALVIAVLDLLVQGLLVCSASRSCCRPGRSPTASGSRTGRTGAILRSRSRSRCSRTRASRPSPTSPRRHESRAARFRARSSRPSGSSSS